MDKQVRNETKQSNLSTDYKIKYSKFTQQNLIQRFFSVLIGSAMGAFAINLFVENVGLLPAGFVGLSKLIQRLIWAKYQIEIPFFVLNLLFNIIPAIFAYYNIGKNFLWLSIVSIVSSSFLMDLIPVFHLTDDLFLSAVIGAAINGAGYLLIYNADASTGGIDFISMSFSNKYNISIFNYVLIFNIIILLISAFMFSLEAALYSIIFQFVSTMILNYGHLRFQRKTCFIITEDVQPLANDLMKLTKHGITVLKVQGCYSGKEQYMLYMVVNRTDVRLIRRYLREHAPKTFMNVTDSEQMLGNFFLEPID